MSHAHRRPLLLLTLCGLALPGPAFGWNDTGHMVIAAIAEKNLNPKAREAARKLCQIGTTDVTNGLWTVACWADDEKTDRDRHWHYTNEHFREDGRPSKNKPLEENVVWAINRFRVALGSDRSREEERAEAFRYLMHFVGDVHQPFHTLARDTDAFPDGDRGGNEFRISPITEWSKRPITNLHILWDFGGGMLRNVDRPLDARGVEQIRNLADRIMREHPRDATPGVERDDPTIWAKEGFALRDKAYDLQENAPVPESYLQRVQRICRHRIALAGYRLANLLNRALG